MSVNRYEFEDYGTNEDDGRYVTYEDYAALEARCAALAAELNAVLTDRAVILEDLDNTCFEIGMQRGEKVAAYPAPTVANHDAFLAEVRASAIPEGYVLVPQEMHLSSEAMEGICFHCGDGGFSFGEFTDGLLFVGAIDDSDGQKIHGLHIATADYPEEGCATVCAFLPAPTEGTAQLRKGGATEEKQSFLSDEDCHAFVKAFTKGAAQ